jgi:uncharacterized membrane protein
MPNTPRHIREHIETIAKHEEEFLARRTTSDRVGDSLGGFVGSLWFVVVHIAWFGLWILINAGAVPGIRPFDPAPFPLLDTVVAIEAIFLASFIVMRQSRLGRRSDERDHLILQVLILAEKEMTAVLKVQNQIAEKIGLTEVSRDIEIAQLAEQTSIDEVVQTIREALPPD